MADVILLNELEKSMMRLKSNVLKEVSASKLTATYARVIDGFVPFIRLDMHDCLSFQEAVGRYYEHVTKAKPYNKPETVYLRRLARPILMIRDEMAGRPLSRKYNYTKCEIPFIFKDDIQQYEDWLTENNYAQGTIRTRIGRIRQFLNEIYVANSKDISALSPDILVNYIGGLNGRYSSIGKTNM